MHGPSKLERPSELTQPLAYILKRIRIPFDQIKIIAIEKNPMDLDEYDEQTHKTSQR